MRGPGQSWLAVGEEWLKRKEFELEHVHNTTTSTVHACDIWTYLDRISSSNL